MKPALFTAVLLGLGGLVAAGQSGGNGSYEDLVKDMLGTVEQITKTLKTIKDRPSADAARPVLKKDAVKLLELRKRADEWKQPNKVQKDRLAKEYAPKFEVAVKQLRELAIAVKSVPGGDEAVEELRILNDKNGKDKDKDKGKRR